MHHLTNTTISCSFIAFIYLHSAIFSSCEASFLQNSSDKLALIDIKSHLTPQYPDDTFLSSWNESLDFCLWAGIGCSKRHHRVTKVTLKGMNLYGDISPSFANLSFLHHLDLSLNSLGGRIPPQLGQLARLRYLNLSFNFLTSEIPPSLCTCSNLVSISLNHNYLKHHIPKEVGLLRNLERLHIHNNNLTGTLPPSLGNLSLLEEVDVSYNQLEGEIPDSIGTLKNLTYLLLAINQFSGVFPPAIYNLSSLKLLAMTNNKFKGDLRGDVGFLFPKIQQLWLSGNEFQGKIPVSLSNVSGIVGVDLSANYFSGDIPSALAGLQELRYINLYGNSLGNYSDDGLAFLDSLANCSSLEFLDVSWNNLGGRLTASVANFSSHLDSLYIEENRISGSIPKEISSLIGLSTLSMSANLLKGNIPSSIGALPLLKYLYIGENLLMGQIPPSIGNLTQLLRFSVYNNTLQGNLPSTFSKLNQLQDARFCHNKLNGTIPSHLLTLKSLVYLNLSHNSFSGSLPSEIGNLTSITYLDVSYNHLSGEIPANLGLCLSLNTLNMEHNFFGGSVPDLSHLKGLEYLDLSKNNLTGKIPDYFVNFGSLLNLNISYNDLKGQVPVIGVFKNETAVQVNGNNNLCGGIQQFNLKPCPKNSTRHVNLKFILPPVVVSCFLLLFVSIILSCRKTPSSPNKRSQSSLGRVHAKISFKELYDATGGFSPDNLIGAGSFGSVYMGILGQGESETQVAIKVLKLHQKGASRSFFAECEALGNIRHRNLVKIMTVCSGVEYNGNDFKALMYPYMSNGSLDKWLHCEGERNLNFLQKVKVAVDVACALEYLHHGCHFPVIHCDLKPSNVLLDGDMTARVGDFGLARLLSKLRGEDGFNQFSSLGIKGTFGYIAPEYGTGSPVSTQGDVYSYGILLMELFSGRRPVDATFEDNFNLHNHVKQSLPDNVIKVIDESALVEEVSSAGNEMMMECLVLVMGIAIACSAQNPQDRINMAEVVNKLAAIRARFMQF